jgi:23S rRNA (cytosine1962-C5)-methyltransferase
MNTIPTLYLQKDQERRILAGNLWIYSNEIDTKRSPLKSFTPGGLVKIVSSRNQNIGIAYLNPNTLLAARLLTRNSNAEINLDFFVKRIAQALNLREMLFLKPFYRLIFGESDFLPGLVVDRFGDVLVGQITTLGMEQFKSVITEALMQVCKPQSIIWRNDGNFRAQEDLPRYVETAHGETISEVKVIENGLEFYAPISEGQKTGWFYDQARNRQIVSQYVKDKRVLDVFSYLGGFGINAASHGATEVVCIDSSSLALEYVKRNAELNNVAQKVKTLECDVFSGLKELSIVGEQFDVIILDPPAFIKKRKDLKTGVEAYRRLHELALNLLKPNGILATFSCSMHFERDNFIDVLRRVGLQTGKNIQILEQLHQNLDHPIHPAIRETEYLKGFTIITND